MDTYIRMYVEYMPTYACTHRPVISTLHQYPTLMNHIKGKQLSFALLLREAVHCFPKRRAALLPSKCYSAVGWFGITLPVLIVIHQSFHPWLCYWLPFHPLFPLISPAFFVCESPSMPLPFHTGKTVHMWKTKPRHACWEWEADATHEQWLEIYWRRVQDLCQWVR